MNSIHNKDKFTTIGPVNYEALENALNACLFLLDYPSGCHIEYFINKKSVIKIEYYADAPLSNYKLVFSMIKNMVQKSPEDIYHVEARIVKTPNKKRK
mmetsp:Transcript_18843/g.26351  ORF Transcript_18843/g.26351 Transcript_18843/m.26351 type:complete len:98 (-) Transcript_18843:76-369(-)